MKSATFVNDVPPSPQEGLRFPWHCLHNTPAASPPIDPLTSEQQSVSRNLGDGFWFLSLFGNITYLEILDLCFEEDVSQILLLPDFDRANQDTELICIQGSYIHHQHNPPNKHNHHQNETLDQLPEKWRSSLSTLAPSPKTQACHLLLTNIIKQTNLNLTFCGVGEVVNGYHPERAKIFCITDKYKYRHKYKWLDTCIRHWGTPWHSGTQHSQQLRSQATLAETSSWLPLLTISTVDTKREIWVRQWWWWQSVTDSSWYLKGCCGR